MRGHVCRANTCAQRWHAQQLSVMGWAIAITCNPFTRGMHAVAQRVAHTNHVCGHRIACPPASCPTPQSLAAPLGWPDTVPAGPPAASDLLQRNWVWWCSVDDRHTCLSAPSQAAGCPGMQTTSRWPVCRSPPAPPSAPPCVKATNVTGASGWDGVVTPCNIGMGAQHAQELVVCACRSTGTPPAQEARAPAC